VRALSAVVEEHRRQLAGAENDCNVGAKLCGLRLLIWKCDLEM
jgi:hypothetical protein